MRKIDAGDKELEEVLRLEAELLARALALLDQGKPLRIVNLLIDSMNGASALEAEARWLQQPDPPQDSPYDPAVNGRLLERIKADLADPQLAIELLVRSMDLDSTQKALEQFRQA